MPAPPKLPVQAASQAVQALAKPGMQTHFAYADTTDPADVIDRIEYQASDDGGKTWRMVAFATGVVPSPPPNDQKGPVQRPGVFVSLRLKSDALFRTVIIHTTGKPIQAKAQTS